MAATAISDFYEAMRFALGDEGEAGSYDYRDEQLAAAIRTTVRAGFVHCVSVDADDPTKLNPSPPNPDTWGYLMLKACYILRGGIMPSATRSRGFSASVQPAAKRDSLMVLESLLADLDEKGNLCGKPTDTGHKGLFTTADDFLSQVRDLCHWTDEPPCYE